MAKILCIETSTKVCSVGLSIEGKIDRIKEDDSEKYSHAENLNPFISEVLSGINFSELEAVAVSSGPGSYTGLRIGVSTAKGICYGKGIPLISINPLAALTNQIDKEHGALYIPMIDARRMEVFCSGFDHEGHSIFETKAQVIEPESFSEYGNFGRINYFGDGAEKCREVLTGEGFNFIRLNSSVEGMASIAERKYCNSEFEDMAYFEPFYLKDFIAGKPKKMGA